MEARTEKKSRKWWALLAVVAIVAVALPPLITLMRTQTPSSPSEQAPAPLPHPSPSYKVVLKREIQAYSVVRVFYGTDRKFDNGSKTFGGQRGALSLGAADVSVPFDHEVGKIERPAWYLALVSAPNPEKHMVLLKQTPLEAKEFFRQIQEGGAGSGEPPSAFIFVHGYRVTFEDAALRTAQMAVDLEIKSVPVFYSWPSQGKLAGYTVDESNAEWTEPHLVKFLEQFADQSRVQKLVIIAHSMGSRAATRALATLLERRKDLAPRFEQLVLAAPDIDAEVFKRDIAPRFVALGRPVTLYASSNDSALGASRKVHGNPRAGESGRSLLIAGGVETIDASDIETDFLGHSYFGDTRPLLTDLTLLVRHGMRAAQRPSLVERTLPAGTDGTAGHYWAFKK